MTTLEALQLVKTKRPDEVSAEELSALRQMLDKRPSLYDVLGGRERVEPYLAEVEAADQAKQLAAQTPTPAISPAQVAQPKPSSARLPRRRVVELSIYAVLILTACAWMWWLLLPRGDQAQGAAADGPAVVKASGAAKPGTIVAAKPGTAVPHSTRGAVAARALAPAGAMEDEPATIWRGWGLEAQSGGHFEKKFTWNLSDPTNPRPVRWLLTGGGRVVLTRRLNVPSDAKSIRIDCAQLDSAAPGEITVLVDGKRAGGARVPVPDSTEPILITLGTPGGRSVEVALTYAPADSKEQVEWRNIAFSSELADVLASSGKPDSTKVSLRLWLRADAGIKDTAQRSPGTHGFDHRVRTWEDQSPNHWHFSCESADAALRPTYTARHGGLSGKAAVTFDGVKQFLVQQAGSVFDQAASTTFAVFEVAGKTGTLFETSAPRYTLGIECRMGATSRKHHHKGIAGQTISFDAPSRMSVDATACNGHFVIAALRTRGAHSYVELNGSGRVAANQAGGPCGTSFILGLSAAMAAHGPAPMTTPDAAPTAQPKSAPPGGSLAELLIYDRALTELEMRQIGAYLQKKYGIVGAY